MKIKYWFCMFLVLIMVFPQFAVAGEEPVVFMGAGDLFFPVDEVEITYSATGYFPLSPPTRELLRQRFKIPEQELIINPPVADNTIDQIGDQIRQGVGTIPAMEIFNIPPATMLLVQELIQQITQPGVETIDLTREMELILSPAVRIAIVNWVLQMQGLVVNDRVELAQLNEVIKAHNDLLSKLNDTEIAALNRSQTYQELRDLTVRINVARIYSKLRAIATE